MRISRILLIALLTMMSGTIMATQSKSYNFKVFLGEKEIGHHRFVVSPYDQRTYVTSEAQFDVKILFISAYTYLHSNSEVWQDDCLRAIQATTDDNGETLFVRGEYTDQRLSLQTPASHQQLSGCVRTFAYWDPNLLTSNRHLLNSQTGELVPVEIQSLGDSTITVRGKPVQANHYRINNHKFSIDLWYSDNQEWLALETVTENGAQLRYQIQ